ncbi:hypothetical protein, partial [Chitinophaga sp.]|uniref:hypothetical protein n=1 Tax=Chitinophaga sp. TaxID=1869181 RepID=UPI002B6D35C2
NSPYHEACFLAVYHSPEGLNFIKIIIEDGVTRAQVWRPCDQTNPRMEILREHQAGNATIIETEGEPGVICY